MVLPLWCSWLSVAALLLLSGCGAPNATAPAMTTPSVLAETVPTLATVTDPSPSPPAVPTTSLPTETVPPLAPVTETASASPTPASTATTGSSEADNPLAGSMDRSQICLYVSDQEGKARIAEELRAALVQVRHHPDWGTVVGATDDLGIAGECEVRLPDGPLQRMASIGPGMVEAPGPWRTVVVVLGEPQATQILGENNLVRASYEMVKISEGEAVEATSALVVREGFLQSAEFITSLAASIGLNPDTLPR